jgi:sugar phosphate isomerase/epimerase
MTDATREASSSAFAKHEIPVSIRSRLSICGVTLRQASFDDQVRIIADSGCTGMGLFHPLLPQNLSASAVRATLDSHGLKASICVPMPFTVLPTAMFHSSEGRRIIRGTPPPDSIAAMIASLRWMAPLDPACVIVIPGAQGDLSAREAWDKAVAGIRTVATAAADLGITLALEPVHPRFARDFSLLSTIDESLEFMADVGASNLGLLVETFHVWDSANVFDQIARAAGRIVGVQLSDSARYPRSQVDRLPPGEGCIDIAAIVRAIEATGYGGWYDIEVVSDNGAIGQGAYPESTWNRPAAELAATCVRGSVDALRNAGL